MKCACVRRLTTVESREYRLTSIMFISCLFSFLLPVLTFAFTPQASSYGSARTKNLPMVPRYDKDLKRWTPSGPEEEPGASYGPVGSLLRQGPSPFFTRLFKSDDYEQAVLKFMAGDNVSRQDAQANKDAYLRNPSDWQYNRMKGYEVDYAVLRPKQIILSLAWSSVVLALLGRGIYCLESGENFWAIFGLTSKVAECVQYNICILEEDKLTGL